MVVMGVAGSGKSTVGRVLASLLDLPFADGDDLHPAANVSKMAAGIPLTDEDRAPWLALVGRWLGAHPEGGVVACSALKYAYREGIRGVVPEAFFVHLAAAPDVLAMRIAEREARDGHFMGPGMLASQLADLEPLRSDERGVTIDVGAVTAEAASH